MKPGHTYMASIQESDVGMGSGSQGAYVPIFSIPGTGYVIGVKIAPQTSLIGVVNAQNPLSITLFGLNNGSVVNIAQLNYAGGTDVAQTYTPISTSGPPAPFSVWDLDLLT